jgi:hypothetical protein
MSFAACRMADATIGKLQREGVTVWLSQDGRLRLRRSTGRLLSVHVRALVERRGDRAAPERERPVLAAE